MILRTLEFLANFFKNKDIDFTRTFSNGTMIKPINLMKFLQKLDSSYVKFYFLNIDSFQWLYSFQWYNINLSKNYKFSTCRCGHLCFDLFLVRFWFSLLTFIKFSIYSRLLNFDSSWNVLLLYFHNFNFFQLVIPNWNFNRGWKSPYYQPLSIR